MGLRITIFFCSRSLSLSLLFCLSHKFYHRPTLCQRIAKELMQMNNEQMEKFPGFCVLIESQYPFLVMVSFEIFIHSIDSSLANNSPDTH